MKASAFKKVCEALAEAVDSHSAGEGWRMIGAVMSASGEKTVKAAFKMISDLSASPGSGGGETLSPLLQDSHRQIELVKAVASKGVVADIEAALAWCDQHSGQSLEALRSAALDRIKNPKPSRASSAKPALDPSELGSMSARLEAALGDDAFDEVLEQVAKDPRLGVAEAKELARLFTGHPGRGKKDSLQRIRNRHLDLIDGRKRLEAIAGRSAA